MTAPARPLPALLAAFALCVAPVAWAAACPCAAATPAPGCACGVGADYGPACCGPEGCETPGPAGEPCGCCLTAPAPWLPAAPIEPPAAVPAPAAAAFARIPAAAEFGSGGTCGEAAPDPAASPPVRVLLCVWRN